MGRRGGRLRTMSSSRWLRQAGAQEGQSDAGVHLTVRAGPLGRGLGGAGAALGVCGRPQLEILHSYSGQACARLEEARFLTSTSSAETALKVTRVVPVGTVCLCICLSVCPKALLGGSMKQLLSPCCLCQAGRLPSDGGAGHQASGAA